MGVSTEDRKNKHTIEIVKWMIAITLLTVVSVIRFIFNNMKPLLYITCIVILITMSFCVILSTKKGREAIILFREAHAEARKVIWPTYRETFYITLIVSVVTAVVSLLLWGLDGVLLYLISLITNMKF